MLLLGEFFLELVLLINQFLLSLDVLKHVFWLWQDDIVREYLRVFLIKTAKFWQSDFSLLLSVGSLQEFIDVIKDQVIFKNWHDVRVLVIDQVIHDFQVVVVSIGRILLT